MRNLNLPKYINSIGIICFALLIMMFLFRSTIFFKRTLVEMNMISSGVPTVIVSRLDPCQPLPATYTSEEWYRYSYVKLNSDC